MTSAQAIVREQLSQVGIILEPNTDIEIADFGLGNFRSVGLSIVVRVNEPEYCSKWLHLLPGQLCPAHYHKVKKETFFVFKGQVEIHADNDIVVLGPGQQHTILPGVMHKFWSVSGAVVEEVSTHDENEDSYFADPSIVRDPIIEVD